MFGAIAGGIASTLAGGLMSKLMGGNKQAAPLTPGQGLFATPETTISADNAGIQSVMQGPNPPSPDKAAPTFTESAVSSLKDAGKGLLDGTLQAGGSAVQQALLNKIGLGGKSAADKGKDTKDYLASAFPELNPWERAGAGASSAGMVDAGFENQKQLTKMQLDNQVKIAKMQNETQKDIAGIQSVTSRMNTKDSVYAQNEMLSYNQKESMSRVGAILENTSLTKQQQVSEIMRQMLTQAQTSGQHFTNAQIQELTRKVGADIDAVRANTERTHVETDRSKQEVQNSRYASSQVGKTAKDVSNVISDASSGIVDYFRGVDKAVADTWNNYWKDGKADGVGSNMSRK
ncbi:minor spike protein [Escherichia phage Lilleto]|nr:minor spike protein [Escherichia phage Lilleto]